MRIISKPVVCAMDSSASNPSIQSHDTLGGLYNVHKRNGFEFGNIISDQRVSMLDISNPFLRRQFSEFLNYKMTPSPVLSIVQHLSFVKIHTP